MTDAYSAEEFEDVLDAHMRAELGLMPKLRPGYHYYAAHPLAPVEIRPNEPTDTPQPLPRSPE